MKSYQQPGCAAQEWLVLLLCASLCRLTGVEAMSKVVQAWGQGALYPDIPPALTKINNAGIKVGDVGTANPP